MFHSQHLFLQHASITAQKMVDVDVRGVSKTIVADLLVFTLNDKELCVENQNDLCPTS